ncbi:MAG TPA: response regulator [Steroidobacteraceae bacterium]|jgi:two-component system chemotaxis response regulator CheY|nr:response regulator [Steroidobacteraceae bacterium]
MNAKRIGILVVDDFPAMRRALKTILTDHLGYSNIIEAEDGNAALQQLKYHDFSLMITDWHMRGGMSGLELVNKVREDERFAHLPVLMLTGESERARIVEAMKAGVTAYLIKPFTTSALREKIETVLSATHAA